MSKPSVELLHLTPEERNQFVNDVFIARTRMLTKIAKETLPSENKILDFNKGRLLAFFPYSNVDDGVAQIESNGYFDFGGYPPYDTWVCYLLGDEQEKFTDSIIIAWVPPRFVDVADMGMGFVPDGSLVWLKELDFDFVEILAKAELLV